jgi:hypothetical protein
VHRVWIADAVEELGDQGAVGLARQLADVEAEQKRRGEVVLDRGCLVPSSVRVRLDVDVEEIGDVAEIALALRGRSPKAVILRTVTTAGGATCTRWPAPRSCATAWTKARSMPARLITCPLGHARVPRSMRVAAAGRMSIRAP